jgi:hypothetical protein
MLLETLMMVKVWLGNDTMIGGAVGGFTFGFILGLKKA